ncbi:MAG TPA: S53 family peptidase [Streptosporangiaceae bacterium]|nr:S53 family peptidase [Streptosporangiaceae bacterium]
MSMARRAAVAAGAFTLTAAAAISAGTAVSASTATSAKPAAGQAGQARQSLVPGVLHARHATSQPPTTAECESDFKIACYEPGQIQTAYNLRPLFQRGVTGHGQTIVIVDSFGSPTIKHDLQVFDKTFGLPAPPNFNIIQPAGKVPAYDPNNSDMVGWAGETTLDVQYAHTMAPGANILLVETPVSETEGVTGFPQIVKAENYVVNHHLGSVISQSFGATEQTFPNKATLDSLRSAFENAAAHHVTVTAATGDSGAADVGLDETTYYLHPVVGWPPSDPLVTAVGGTQLHLNAAGQHTSPDTVWNDTYNKATQEYIFGNAGPNPLAGNGGKSVFFSRPWYQDGVKNVVGNSRGLPDISMSGACNGAVDTYNSYGGLPAGWYPTCGTSEATPIFSGVVALADQVAGYPLGLINPALYQLSAEHAPGIVDVTSGNTTVSFTQNGKLHTVKGANATRGYDLASGVGTINGAYFVPELAWAAGRW